MSEDLTQTSSTTKDSNSLMGPIEFEKDMLTHTDRLQFGHITSEALSTDYWNKWLKSHIDFLNNPSRYQDFSENPYSFGMPSLEHAAIFMETFAQGVNDRLLGIEGKIDLPIVSFIRPKILGYGIPVRNLFTLLNGKEIMVIVADLNRISQFPIDIKSKIHLGPYTTKQFGYLGGREEAGHAIFLQMHHGYVPYQSPYGDPVKYDSQEHEFIELRDRLTYVEKHLDQFDEAVLNDLKTRYEKANKYRESGTS